MPNKLFKKGLVIGIIVLFIGLAFIPSFNAVSISMLDNHPPEAPEITGRVTCKSGETYDYTFKAIDPDDDVVRYFIDWDDGTTEWTDYYASGEQIIVNHSWEMFRYYQIKARANDTHGALGPWGYLQWSKVDKDEDCLECQSNGKTHLTEKLLNRLEKNDDFTNLISPDNPTFERPICILLNNTFCKIMDLVDYYNYLKSTLPEDSILLGIIEVYTYILTLCVVPYIAGFLLKLNCWEFFP